jgi:hypothetical protein
MSNNYLHHRQKRPHGGYNGSQEWCLQPYRNRFHGGDSNIQADDNVVEADLSDSRLQGHLVMGGRPSAGPILITGLMGELSAIG